MKQIKGIVRSIIREQKKIANKRKKRRTNKKVISVQMVEKNKAIIKYQTINLFGVVNPTLFTEFLLIP